jgi:nitrate reductase gamma subunit
LYITDVPWVFKVHIVLGLTIFLIFPFTRLVHIWSGFATIAYLFRPYQIVRTRKRIA